MRLERYNWVINDRENAVGLKTLRTLRTTQLLRHGSIGMHDKYKSGNIIVYVSAGCLAKQQVNRGARAFRKRAKIENSSASNFLARSSASGRDQIRT